MEIHKTVFEILFTAFVCVEVVGLMLIICAEVYKRVVNILKR